MMGWELPLMVEHAKEVRRLGRGPRARRRRARNARPRAPRHARARICGPGPRLPGQAPLTPAPHPARGRAQICASGGDVLNIGFGLGLVDEEIQKHKPRSHTIVEAHPGGALWGVAVLGSRAPDGPARGGASSAAAPGGACSTAVRPHGPDRH
jgi:hypothetical protein